jgi:hypothetical protein
MDFCIFVKFSLGAILRTARTSWARGIRLPIGGDQGHRNRLVRSWESAPTRGHSRMVDLRQTGMDRHRSYVSAPRSWHGSSSNTRACESRRRVVVFSENQNRIVVNELWLGPLSADEKRKALQCVSFLPFLPFLPYSSRRSGSAAQVVQSCQG